MARGADEFEQPPINYSQSTPLNKVSALQDAIQKKTMVVRRDDRLGYLPDLLDKLKIPVESQLLVFSKTSMQRDRISPRTPRAIYFNDDVYVGFCHAGNVLEISTADRQLGTVYYTLDQNEKPPVIRRQTESCLQCHGSAGSDGVPGHLVRSVFVNGEGLPLLAEGSFRVDHTTPLENRWGGWYVTGTHGAQRHLGNMIVSETAPRAGDNADGQNVTSLREKIDAADYLTGHSDIVALLVFEHQTHVHNLITQAGFATRQALYYEAELNRAFGEPVGNRRESTTRRIESAADKLVDGLLFVNEAPLTARIVGTSGFAEQFVRAAVRDRQGRSLRDFDLKTRLFKHPCSYLIYSPAFDDLPPVMKECVATKLRRALAGNGGEQFSHLNPADRQAISEILEQTKPDWWRVRDR
ncbi:MAG: hypothetical protein K8T25_24235 [Planctomycetia bacterium]|nr:hypothetical protein [Planctomycetia bacterium]